MNRSDIARIAHQGRKLSVLLEQHGPPLFTATKDWQTPLRSGGAPGGKGGHSDPTGLTASANLQGEGDPLAVVHDEYQALLRAKRLVDAKLAQIVGHKRLVDLLKSKEYADNQLAAFVYRHKPIDPNTLTRGRVNLVPSCIVCSGPAIPIRRGMCEADYRAWMRANQPDLEGFKRARQREAEAEAAVVHEHEAAS